jgi:hypothetical protein
MLHHFNYSSLGATLLALGIGVSSVGWVTSHRASTAFAQESPTATPQVGGFPDVTPDYWASPFIRVLAEQNIIQGYLDGTFRPEQPVDRDEFAAMIRQAFNQEREKTIPSGSVFNDVPNNYWAAPPIEEAYETGFMTGFPGRLFLPQQEVSRVQAIVSLTNGLELGYNPATTAAATTPAQQRRASKKPIFFPLAFSALMEPVLKTATLIPAAVAPATTATDSKAAEPAALDYVQSYYQDAEQIPDYALEKVAAATQEGMVVNYPNPKLLNPNDPLNRGAAAALIYQALVRQGKLQPLAENEEANRYVVVPTSENNQNAQAAR